MQAVGRYGLTQTDAPLMSVLVLFNECSFIRSSGAFVHYWPNTALHMVTRITNIIDKEPG